MNTKMSDTELDRLTEEVSLETMLSVLERQAATTINESEYRGYVLREYVYAGRVEDVEIYTTSGDLASRAENMAGAMAAIDNRVKSWSLGRNL